MEMFSWLVHKYIMHGALWFIHKTHHEHNKGFFEANDLFSIFFGSIAVILIVSGLQDNDFKLWVGVGISTYGLLYFVLHDILIHKRVKLWNMPKSLYLRAISKAHRDHHKSLKKEDSCSFGLFFVSRHYFNLNKKSVPKNSQAQD